ncbi:hypothetical protein LSCM1_07348 [Leishmania martiniquensis]|uniref:Uncharacterized protein n=1 Tax=Leishmania martiniquensis TaxID=1580590 RepID=A0A836H3J8_9TRYP|nr:hypothetical protein LSCM1_07348 [Leishmania martiniquensis]
MVPGADSGYTYSSYYTSRSRAVYLSADACSSVLAGTSAATVTPSGSVSFATADIAASVSAVALCAGTAAGPAVVLSGVTVARGKVYPTVLVSGALGAPVFIPSVKGATVQLSASASGCGSVAGMPSFTTDAEGYGAVDLVGGDGGALAVGTYTLCYADAAARAVVALESVALVRASYFDVRGTTFVVGVASRMLLLQDLTSAALVPGFSTVRNCTSVSSEQGAWAAVTSTSVSVTAASVYTAGLYLCARAPVNGTLVALPGRWAEARGVQFVASSIQLPSAGWDVCTTYTLDQCYPPGASVSSATSVLAVAYGDCCSASSRSAVVGEASMASGTCELRLDYDKVSAHPPGSTYHVCVWDTADDSVCTTVGEARVRTNCTSGGGAGRGLSRGAVAGVVMACVTLSCSSLSLLLWCFCCRRKEAVPAAGFVVDVSGDSSRSLKPCEVPSSQFRCAVGSPVASCRSGRCSTSTMLTEVTLAVNPLMVTAAYNSGAALLPDDLPIIPVTLDDKIRTVPKLEWEHRRRLAAREGEARRVLRRHLEATLQEAKAKAAIGFMAGRHPMEGAWDETFCE